jgi:hypothetical protein
MLKHTTVIVVAILTLGLAACGGGEPAVPLKLPTKAPLENPATGNTANSTAVAASPASDQDVIADLGFRPEADGFAFANYGKSEFKNLTPAEMKRIYGDSVCAVKQNDQCTLTPPAEQWMTQMNESMDGGHCFGFSVAALSMYAGIVQPAAFGGATPISLTVENNEALQREIAYSFVFQRFDPVRRGAVMGTPNDVLDKLIKVLQAGSNATEVYTIGFFRADGSGGHAVTPFAVEDRGNDVYAVLIYDNNYPEQTRSILFDRQANSWNYTTSTNPSEPTSEYQGNAQTKSLFLFPTTPGLKKQACTFCKGGGSSSTQGVMLAQAAVEYNEIYLDGDPTIHAHLLLTDETGKQVGYLPNGTFVQDIPGVEAERLFTDLSSDTPEPTYYVPTTMPFTMTIDGTPLQELDYTDVTMIGPGYDLGVWDIGLEPGQQDTLVLSSDGTDLSYTTESSESPLILFGVELDGADYEFEIQGVDLPSGGTINVSLDTQEGWLLIDTSGTAEAGEYTLSMTRYDDDGEEGYTHEGIVLEPADVMYIYYGEWTGNGGALEAGIDYGGDGTVDEQLDFSDNN